MQKLAEVSIRRPVFAAMLNLALVVGGVFAYFSLGVDLYPAVDLPMVTVTTVAPGASAEEVESSITETIEAAVNTVSGLESLQSTSTEGVSVVIASFALEKDGDVAAQEVRDRISVLTDLPAAALAPTVEKLDVGAAPILQVAVASDRALAEVTEIADTKLQRRLERVAGVGRVEMIGGSERAVEVVADADRLRAYGLGVGALAAAIQQADVEIPGGRITTGRRELTVRTLGRLESLDALGAVPVGGEGDRVVRLRDVATIRLGEKEERTRARLDGAPAVTLQVVKQSGENTVEVAKAVKTELAAARAELPPDVRTVVLGDQSVFIEAAVDTIREHLVLGGLMAALVVLLFLRDLRATVIAALAIPTSLIATFVLMAAVDYTLNQITMLALALMVGIVIDDAIVVLENIVRWVEEKGLAPREAAIAATREIGLAVMATTLSLLAVFLPVGFMKGMVGRFMASFGLTAAFAIAVSLFVSFTLTPMMAARLVKRREAGAAEAERGGLYGAVERRYLRLLDWSMAHRGLVVLGCVAIVLSTVPIFALVGKDFTPKEDQSSFQVTVSTAPGSTLEATSLAVERLSRALGEMPEVTSVLSTVGGGSSASVDDAALLVELVPMDEREATQEEVMERARQRVAAMGDAFRTSSVEATLAVGGGQRVADVQWVVRGPDLERIESYAASLRQTLEAIPGAVDPDTSIAPRRTEVQVAIDRERAAELGVSAAAIASALSLAVGGEQVTTLAVGGESVPVMLRAGGELRGDPEALGRLVVPSARLGWVSLDSVATIGTADAPAAIERGERQRQVTLSADVGPGAALGDIVDRMKAATAALDVAPGYTVGPAGASKELTQAGVYFMISFALSFLFMYMVLAAQFESLLKPLIILFTLPLAVPFGVLSLLVMGQSINLFSGLGILLLFGIVKKNAILQIDHMSALRARGLPRAEAIREANRDRLRPILMTTLALVAGMLPLALSTGVGSGGNRSIGVLVVGGQTLCLLVTLLAVPVLDSLAEDLRDHPAWRRLGGRLRARRRGDDAGTVEPAPGEPVESEAP